MVKTAAEAKKEQAFSSANERFIALLPELQSRARALSCRYPKRMRSAAADDALCAMYLNHAQAFHRGDYISPSNLAFYAGLHLRHRSDVTKRYHQRRSGRDHYIESTDHGDVVPELGRTLTCESMRDPAYQTQINLDWDRFADGQDRRHRKILTGIARGDRKGEIAASIAVSNGRLTQLLDGLKREISAYFAGDLPLNSVPQPA
jgi:hypothetical protein